MTSSPRKNKNYPIVPVVFALSTEMDRPTILSPVRALGRKGIPCYVIARGKMPLLKSSRYARKVYTFNGDLSMAQWQEQFEQVLEDMGPQQRKPVFMLTTEIEMNLFLPIKDFLEEHFCVLPSFSEVGPSLEKDYQNSLAEKAGFCIPKTCRLEKKTDIELCEQQLSFPIIVKPLARHTEGCFKKKVIIVESKERFRETVGIYLDQPPTVLLAQEFIPGGDNDILVFMCSTDSQGQVRAFVSGKKTRQYPPDIGTMAAGCLERNEVFEEKATNLCKLFRIQGFIGIECKRPPGSDDYYYVEASFRPELFNSLAEGAGVNLVFDAYMANLGQSRVIPETASKGSWCSFQDYLDSYRLSVRQGKTTWKDYWKPLPRPLTWAIFAWDDPLPFLRWFFGAAMRKLKRICGG